MRKICRRNWLTGYTISSSDHDIMFLLKKEDNILDGTVVEFLLKFNIIKISQQS